MNQHRGPAAIQGRDQIRRVEEISARHDSPNGGLRALREKNATEIQARDALTQSQEVAS